MGLVSYAQNYEDVLLNRVFGGRQVGFYIDVGAYHPVDGSVTKLFYDRGWSGINVEPGSIFDLLAAERPRDVNLRMAVLDRKGVVSFLETAVDRGMSHVVEQDVGCSVPCDTLEAILENHGMGRPVDFVKIDAEGAEAAIVRSTDWRRLRPHVLVIEATKPWSNVLVNQGWEPGLLGAGYVRAYFDGINCFYVPEEQWPILDRHFSVPVNVLDGAVTGAHDLARVELVAAQGKLAGTEAELVAAQGKLAGTEAELVAAQGKLAGTEAELVAAQGKLAGTEAELVVTQGKLAGTEAELVVTQGKLAGTEAELVVTQGKLAGTEAELVVTQGKLAGTEAELVELRDANDQALSAVAVLRQGLDNANAELQQKEAYIQQLTVPQPLPAVSQPVLARRPLRRFARRLALLCYRFVRPVVRPVAWRVRSFLTGPSLAEIGIMQNQLRQLDERVSTMPLHSQSAAQLDHLASAAQLDHLARSIAEVHAGSSAQLKQLAKAFEDIVVTLAIASPHQLAGGAARGDSQVATSRMLRLANGRLADIEVGAADLSVGATLHAANGDWEPHVRGYLESVVRSDWVCMDIGANLGVHTLSLAILARNGRVIAFEADPGNFALLTRNVAILPQPKGHVQLVHAALWDSTGHLTICSTEQLAGCAFVATGSTDATTAEARLRAVVDPGAIAELELQLHLTRVPAVRLDDWMRDYPLTRLDLIRLDVEGAEKNVIRGADSTLRRFRPRLLVAYKPACARTYFDQPADELYRDLVQYFAAIYTIEPDGSLNLIPDWAALATRLAAGKGWEDLLCVPETESVAQTIRK